MSDFFASEEFKSGLISGIVLSFLIWFYQLFSRQIKVIRVVFPDKTQNRIGIINVSLWKINFIELKGQISYLHNNIRNRNTFQIEGEKSYISPESIKGLPLIKYLKYHFLRKDLINDLNVHPRFLAIDLSLITLNPPFLFNNFHDLDLWKNQPDNNITKVSLNVFVLYYGRITNTLKIRKEELD